MCMYYETGTYFVIEIPIDLTVIIKNNILI